MGAWKNPLLLIAGIGISYLGNWMYLIALNLAILHMTGSPAAIAGLFIIRPLAVLLTNTWSGSMIDRMNKRKILIYTDVIRGLLVFLIPFIESLWLVYFLLLIINIFGAFFRPASVVYITKLVPQEKRKRFNSLLEMTSSGAMLLGPAIAGIFIMYFGTDICIFINAITFFVCAFLIFLLPDVDEVPSSVREPLRWQTLMKDWQVIMNFARTVRFFTLVYLLFQSAMLIGFALDSQELTYIKLKLHLSDQDYGFIVSMTGGGLIAGSFFAALLANKIALKYYVGGGMLLTSIGYVLFFSSFNFLTATAAFVFLGFFISFANAGYATFFQNNVPVQIMGRLGSIAEIVQGLIQIGLTLVLGFFAEWFSLQFVCLTFAAIGMLLALILFSVVLQPSKASFFKEKTENTS